MIRYQLSGVFSGLLAAAIQNMEGIGGRPGWAWIFILVCTPLFSSFCFTLAFFFLSLLSITHSHLQQEGLFSILIGITSFFLVPSTPRDSKFLTLHEKQLIQERLELDRPAITPNAPSDKFSFREILNSDLNPRYLPFHQFIHARGDSLWFGTVQSINYKSNGIQSCQEPAVECGPFCCWIFP